MAPYHCNASHMDAIALSDIASVGTVINDHGRTIVVGDGICWWYFGDIVTGEQYLMGMVIPAQRQWCRYHRCRWRRKWFSPPLPPGTWRDLAGDARAVNCVWTKKRGEIWSGLKCNEFLPLHLGETAIAGGMGWLTYCVQRKKKIWVAWDGAWFSPPLLGETWEEGWIRGEREGCWRSCCERRNCRG